MNGQPNETMKSANSEKATARRVAPTLHGVAAWRELLSEEEERCDRTGFQAGIISIDHGPTDPSLQSVDTADSRTSTIAAVVADHLEFTHRMCVLNENEIGILMIPVADVGATERFANTLNAALRSVGISAAIGFALRRDDGNGLFGAAARADACAAVAHSRQIRLTA